MSAGPALARAVLPSTDLDGDVEFFAALGFRLDAIWPADDPAHALLSTDGCRVELRRDEAGTATVVVPVDHLPPDGARHRAPGGAHVELVVEAAVELPAGGEATSVVTHLDGENGWVVGRAGMRYRDLVPGRLGGRYIASHIEIPDGGEVPDYVHFHDVVFQMIFCAAGWVRLVYEDQGPPFVLHAGDCVLQPPLIRHRVLAASPGLEVVEIGCPALHETFADHELALPNGAAAPGKSYGGQHFLHHVAATAPWSPWHGGEAQAAAVGAATHGLGEARVVRAGAAPAIEVPAHDGELVFGFVLAGSARLEVRGRHELGPADAFAVPPGEEWLLRDASADFRLLHVTTAPMGDRSNGGGDR
jgi:quercetin dioxygenase-like cupin family protein